MINSAEFLCPSCHKPNAQNALFCQHCGFDMVLNNDAPSDDLRYSITRIIKAGGQGAVYEGVDQNGRIYAIKEMLDAFSDPEERTDGIKRFNAEAELLQSLSHPRIPNVYSHFTDEGRHYLTMDLVVGEDLEQIVEREGAVSEDQVLKWAYQICDVLAYLHDNGLVYRDMKPSNVMIEKDGNVKLIDFGIAKHFQGTKRGTQIGTPGYAPPEQYQGIATPVSDVYALGATLHHLLTGRDPTREAPFSFPPARDVNINVSRNTSDAIEKALSTKAEDRYQTVVELRLKLRTITSSKLPDMPATAASTIALSSSNVAQAPTAPAPSRGTGGNTATQQTPRVAAQPAPAPASSQRVAAKPQPKPSAAKQKQAHPAPAPQQKSATRKGRGSGMLIGLLIAFVLLVGGGAATYFFVFAGSDTTVTQPNTQPTFAPLPSTPVQFEVEVVVDEGADDATIHAAFYEAFEEKASQKYGGNVTFNKNISPFIATGNPNSPMWTEVGEENGSVRYEALMETRLQR